MAGFVLFPKKVRGPWHQGVCFDLPIFFCLIYIYKNYQGTAKKYQGGFDLRPELHAKNVFFWLPPSVGLWWYRPL
jgi:hypothetical protein